MGSTKRMSAEDTKRKVQHKFGLILTPIWTTCATAIFGEMQRPHQGALARTRNCRVSVHAAQKTDNASEEKRVKRWLQWKLEKVGSGDTVVVRSKRDRPEGCLYDKCKGRAS